MVGDPGMSRMVNGTTSMSQYLPTVAPGSLSMGSITFDTNTVSSVSSSMNYCNPCGTYWYPWYGHYCSHVHAEAHEHDYQQADGAFNDTLYCRKCGETKRLKARKENAS